MTKRNFTSHPLSAPANYFGNSLEWLLADALPEVTHRQLIRHDRSENFNGCGKCLALLISSSGSEVTVAAYSLALARIAFNQLRIRLYEKLPLVYSHSADRTNAPAHLGSHCGLHVFLCLRRPPGPGRKSTGAAGGSTGAAAGPREQLILPAWEQDEADWCGIVCPS